MGFSTILYSVGGFVRKNLPIIMVAGGGACTVASVITASVHDTPKALKALDTASETRGIIEKAHADGVTADGTSYSEDDYKKDLTIVNVQTSKELIKAYLPSMLLEIGGLALIGGGVGILNSRLVTATTTLAATTGIFNNYRAAVAEDRGNAQELKYYLKANGVENSQIKSQNIKETVVDVNTGEIEEITGKALLLDSSVDENNPLFDNPYVVCIDLTRDKFQYLGMAKTVDGETRTSIAAALRQLRIEENQQNRWLQSAMSRTVRDVLMDIGFSPSDPIDAANIDWKLASSAAWGVNTGSGRIDFGIFDKDGNANPVVSADGTKIYLILNVGGNIFSVLDDNASVGFTNPRLLEQCVQHPELEQ